MKEGPPEGLVDLLGRLHPALVHFPIAWLVLLLVVDFVGLVLGRPGWRQWGQYVLWATALSVAPSIATGLLRAGHLHGEPALAQLLVIHRTLNLIVGGLVVAALVLRLLRRDRLDGAVKWLYVAAVLLATALVLVAGAYGGKIVYGPDYLPF